MFVRRKKYVCTSICSTRSSPAAIFWWIHWWLGLKRRVWPPIPTRPVCLLRRDERLRVGEAVGDGDLDLHVLAGLQALAIPCAACIWVGVQRMTASTSGRARLSASSVVTWPMPKRLATSCVSSRRRPTIETTLTPSISRAPRGA